GKGIYSFDDDFRFSGVQVRIADNNMGTTLLPIDLNKIGFASYSLRRRGAALEPVYNNRYFVFNEQVWIAQKGRLRRASIDCPFPERIRAKVIYAARTDNAPQPEGPDYLMFDIALPAVSDDPENYFNRFIVPYGNYPGRNGACMGMVEIPGGVYKFHVDNHWAVRLPAGREVMLSKATQRDYSVFEKYQQINVGIRATPDAFKPDSLRQLRQMDELTQRRFDMVLKRAEQMLIDAERALNSRSWQVESVLQKFMPAAWSAERKQFFIIELAENIHKVRSALPMLKRDKLDVIGFGDAYRLKSDGGSMVADENYARAEALSGSMALDMYFRYLKRGLIYFDEQHFSTAVIDELASDLVHELSHARYRSRDTISEASTARIYPNVARFDQNLIDIAPLVAAAAQAGSDTINHASSFEHLVVTLAYTQSDKTVMLLHSFFNGGTRYSRKPDAAVPDCVDACVLSR
ncbi:MAG TPA: hypothetical protein VNX00_14475, partial [Herbaspirillum sp.]|nr:hypothetical protein [Herbaspirillum sp.]